MADRERVTGRRDGIQRGGAFLGACCFALVVLTACGSTGAPVGETTALTVVSSVDKGNGASAGRTVPVDSFSTATVKKLTDG